MATYQYRDAQTGEFVTQEFAEAHPDVTVRETVEGKPDILALQARVAQLEAALREAQEIQRAAIDKFEVLIPHSQDSDEVYDRLTAVEGVLDFSDPALDVSPLWGVLALELQFWDDKNTSKVEATSRRLQESVDALTPELRTLIKEMAKGGRE